MFAFRCTVRLRQTLSPIAFPQGLPSLSLLDGVSSLDALLQALQNLDDLYGAIDDAYKQSYNEAKFQRFDEQEEGDAPTLPSILDNPQLQQQYPQDASSSKP